MLGIIPEGAMSILIIILPILLIIALIWGIFKLIGWYASTGSSNFCPRCNKKLYANHETCPHCGCDLINAEV